MNLRAKIDVLIIIGFLIETITGIGLYFSASGKLAKLGAKSLFGMNKFFMTSIHTYVGFILVVLIIIHLLLGWKQFNAFLKSK